MRSYAVKLTMSAGAGKTQRHSWALLSGFAGMDVVWQEGAGSFLDSSGIDPSSFAGGNGGPWSASADSPVFSAQSVLWDSGADSPADSRIGALTADSAGGADTDALPASSWIADAGSNFAGVSGALDDRLLWTAAGSDTSSSLASNGSVGLGALDLGAAGSTSSQWQQFVNEFTGGSATGLAEVPQLLWTGGAGQPITVPLVSGMQSFQVPASDSLPAAALGNLAPTQLMWSQPSAATGLTSGPTLTDAAPTPPLSGAGIGVPSVNGPVISGAGSHS